jgi:hypothetical protein
VLLQAQRQGLEPLRLLQELQQQAQEQPLQELLQAFSLWEQILSVPLRTSLYNPPVKYTCSSSHHSKGGVMKSNETGY